MRASSTVVVRQKRRDRRLGSLAAGLLVVVLLAPILPAHPVNAQTLDDLDVAERRVADIEAELDEATEAYEDTWAAIELAEVELAGLLREEAALVAEAERTQELIVTRARSAYMRGAPAAFELVLGAESSTEALERASVLELINRRGLVRIDDAEVLQVSLEQVQAEVAVRQSELEAQRAQLRADAELLQERLAEAEAQATTIRTLVARQRRIDRGPQQGIYACIFDRGTFRFRDTWGAPRSGGRRHRGTDVFAPMNQPTYAFTSGVVERHSNSRLGGLGLYLRGVDGNVYYYAHLASIEPKGAVGNWVVAGDLIARNGYSGNADPWAPHVHFELHPGGGSAINPYPWLAAACF